MKPLVEQVEREAVKVPQPEIHIRADANTDYKNVGKVIAAINRGGVVKVGFITEPDHGVRGRVAEASRSRIAMAMSVGK